MFSFKKANKNIQKRARRASDYFYDLIGLSPRKEFLKALSAGDEEKAIEIYVLRSNGKSLEVDMCPSLPLLESDDQTPMHWAARKGMAELMEMFYAHGGNPSVLNSSNQSCLHAVCYERGRDDIKSKILKSMLQWEQSSYACNSDFDRVSVNYVDCNGNTACHYAAASGLEQCVRELVNYGGIISIVNKDQMTCCEIADANNNVQLADFLELALLFQPAGESELFLSRGQDFLHELDRPLFVVDVECFTLEQLIEWCDMKISIVKDALPTLSTHQAESMLTEYNWNLNDVVSAGLSHHQNIKSTKESEIMQNKDCSHCPICAEEFTPFENEKCLNVASSECSHMRIECGSGHAFCMSCWSTHLKILITESSHTALSCPAFKCEEVLDVSEWAEILLGSDVLEQLKKNMRRRLVDTSPGFKWCPGKDCELILRYDVDIDNQQPPLVSTIVCDNGHSVCVACTKTGHAPCSCDIFDAWTKKVSQEVGDNSSNTNDVATALWVQANTKKCPKCQTPIQKDEGCNHMTCKKCRHDFCWICMQKWESHSNSTGGYFQCNKLISNDEFSEISNDDELGESRMLSEGYSAGSSTKEAYRLKKNAAVMDRFIQHYTSFKAHDESWQLEVKMQHTTMSRMLANHSQPSSCEFDFQFSCKGDLHFLRNGFNELARCRQLLKAFFPFSYYVLHNAVKMEHKTSFHQLDHQAFMQSQVESVDRARSDLEIVTETLSNVLARKRLRASQCEIERATRCARSQRLELEHTLQLVKQHIDSRKPYSQGTPNKMLKQRKDTVNNLSIFDRIVGNMNTFDFEHDSLGQSLYMPIRRQAEIRRQSKSIESDKKREKPLNRKTSTIKEAVDIETINFTNEEDLGEKDDSTSRFDRFRSASADSSSSSSSSCPSVVNVRQVGSSARGFPIRAASNNSRQDGESTVSDDEDISLAMESEINRAILLSLQSSSLSEGMAKQEDVQAMMTMGFSREESIAALKFCSGVEDAVTYLLSQKD